MDGQVRKFLHPGMDCVRLYFADGLLAPFWSLFDINDYFVVHTPQ